MDESVQTVKLLLARLEGHIEEFPNGKNIERNKKDYDALVSILKDVEEFHARALPVDPELGDVSNLPPELVKELTLSTPSELEQRIISIIDGAPEKTTNINTILVELYKRHKVIQKRRNMQNKLWRMMDNKLIWSVPNEKGVYTTVKPSVLDINDAAKLSDIDDENGALTFGDIEF